MESVGTMQCPRDQGRLDKIGFSGINLDSCPNCDGVWLQKGELARLHGLKHDLLPGPGGQDPRGPVPCPACPESTMETRYFSHASQVLIDYCPRCEGIWLDQAELTRILQEVYRLKVSSTVYINSAGKAYHTKGCPRRGGDAQAISFEKAQASGKQRCKLCGPPEIELEGPKPAP